LKNFCVLTRLSTTQSFLVAADRRLKVNDNAFIRPQASANSKRIQGMVVKEPGIDYMGNAKGAR
jgi:hypothetical protein